MRDLSAQARQVLQAARTAEGPTAADKARIKAQLDARLADPNAVEPDLGPDPTAATTGAGPTLASAAKIGAVATVGAVALWFATSASEPVVEAPRLVEPARGPGAYQTKQVRTVPAPMTETPDDVTPAARPRARAPAAADPARTAASRLAAEAALVRHAQAAVRDADWGRALELAAEHRAEFPRGALIEERLALEVIAACGAVEPDREARARDELRETHPDSLHWTRIRAACAAR